MAEPAAPAPRPRVNLGSVEKIPSGQGFCFIVAGREIAVFRQRDGRLFAIQNRCPHLNGPLSEGVVGDGKVICPLHSRKFDLSTGEGSSSGDCVQTFQVREEKGEVLLGPEAVPAARKKAPLP